MRVRDFVSPSSASCGLWNPKLQTLSRPELDALHLRRIQDLVAYAYENSPLYRRIYDDAGIKPADIRTWDDFFVKLPFVDKPDLVADQDAGNFPAIAVPDEYQAIYFQTTGTTGKFLQESFTEWDMARLAQHYCYMLWDFGVRPTDSVLLYFNFNSWAGLWSFYWACRLIGIKVYSGSAMSTKERIAMLDEWKPTIVAATPTYLLHVAEVAQQEGVDLRTSSVRYVMGGGEPGLSIPVTRRAVEEAWGAEAMDAYGVSEAATVFASCKAAEGGGVHVIEDSYHAYAVDDAGNPVADGEVGENIVTSYSHVAQPIIKYRTHDLVRLELDSDHHRSCSWSWAYLNGSVLGRTDYMVQIRGVNVYPSAVESMIGHVDGATNHYELHIMRDEGFDRMEVKVEAANDAIDRDRLAQTLDEECRRALGVRLQFSVLEPGALPRYELKSRRMFDHRPKEVRRELDR
jgi:phenylacetate-CoA ligase